MSNHIADIIGNRGEIIFELAITHYQTFGYPLFKTAFLGEKWPAIDYYVQLSQIEDITPFFSVQIKSTHHDINDATQTLNINVSQAQCESLLKMSAPTYIVGVHEPMQKAFILSIHTKLSQGVYRIPLKYELTPSNLQILHQEVCNFWRNTPHKPSSSYFV